MRNKGNAGEAFVQAWCSLGGITANKAVIDMFGWDLFFEMSSGYDLSTAAGLHKSAYECKVQVKTTDGGPKSISIELSNLHAMATTTLPAFYLLVDMGHGHAPKAAYLIHIDDSHRERILERIRKETTKNKDVKLNEKKMSLKFSSAPLIEPLNGDGLKAAIVACIGGSQAEYVNNKQQHISSVGYGPGATSFTFKVDAEDMKRFVGMVIGDHSTIAVKDFKAFQTRFGIRDELPDEQRETAQISIMDEGPKELGKMVFKSLSRGSSIEWVVDVSRGALADWVPDQYRLMRMRAERITIDIRPDGKAITFWIHKKDKDQSTLKEILKFYQLLAMMQHPGGVELTLEAAGRKLTARISIEGMGGDFATALKIVKDVQKVQGEYGYYDDITISPNELFTRSAIIQEYLHLIEGDEKQINPAANGYEAGATEVLVPDFFKLGDVLLVSIIVFLGKANGVDRRQIFRSYCMDEPESRKVMVAEVQKRANSYQGPVPIINLTDKVLEPFHRANP